MVKNLKLKKKILIMKHISTSKLLTSLPLIQVLLLRQLPPVLKQAQPSQIQTLLSITITTLEYLINQIKKLIYLKITIITTNK